MMIAGQEKNVVSSPAKDDVEVVENVATQNTQVCGRGVGEGGHFPTNTSGATVDPQKLDYRVDDDVIASPADPFQGQSRRRRLPGKIRLLIQVGTQNRAICTAIHEKMFVYLPGI